MLYYLKIDTYTFGFKIKLTTKVYKKLLYTSYIIMLMLLHSYILMKEVEMHDTGRLFRRLPWKLSACFTTQIRLSPLMPYGVACIAYLSHYKIRSMTCFRLALHILPQLTTPALLTLYFHTNSKTPFHSILA